jgi:polysaccharide export outer membrane protein
VSFLSISNVMAAGVYRLQAGDSLNISVWGEDTLQQEVQVLPDGSITFPLAGRVEIFNATVAEAESRLTKKLEKYLPDPQVTVVVSKIEGNRIFILGKVLTPGPVLMTGPMTVMQALSLAGGLGKFADLSSIKVLRNGPKGQMVIPVNYNKLIRGESLSSNVLLKTGDTILIP